MTARAAGALLSTFQPFGPHSRLHLHCALCISHFSFLMSLLFSHRLPPDLDPNPLTRVVSELRAAGVPFHDLTESNPTLCGFEYPSGLLDCLADARGLRYDPQPLGLPVAREAVAADYARRSVRVLPDRVVITASSSESYALLFKLLCDPGDSVLVPEPSYPLFEHLASLEGVRAQPYRLEYHGRWTLHAEDLARAADAGTRAVLVVSPNNPTGTILSRDESRDVQAFCGSRGLALIGDEVFCDYPIVRSREAARSVLEEAQALTVSLGGLSKSVGLPQLKLGWLAIAGPDELVGRALQRLEVIADTYLSVATPVQLCLPRLLEVGASVRAQIADRLLLNFDVLETVAEEYPAFRVMTPEGGWSAVVQAPALMPDEAQVIALLRGAGVLVHPGYFFGFDRPGYFVVSLLAAPDQFRDAVSRMFDTMVPPTDR
jgi:alanine-synthesizing transaminase